jgi:hypothetical protein
MCRFNLLAHFWIDRLFLLGNDWQGKADCRACNYK